VRNVIERVFDVGHRRSDALRCEGIVRVASVAIEHGKSVEGNVDLEKGHVANLDRPHLFQQVGRNIGLVQQPSENPHSIDL